mmetsp:Transcript_10427/g.23862  ORF Transcript_10427/g.23862 Transcript_10427/m.23862 type:complete len:103 (-) Transcript_10427:55-363(-)
MLKLAAPLLYAPASQPSLAPATIYSWPFVSNLCVRLFESCSNLSPRMLLAVKLKVPLSSPHHNPTLLQLNQLTAQGFEQNRSNGRNSIIMAMQSFSSRQPFL